MCITKHKQHCIRRHFKQTFKLTCPYIYIYIYRTRYTMFYITRIIEEDHEVPIAYKDETDMNCVRQFSLQTLFSNIILILP